jgi:serine/threonine-protein kinase
MTQCPPRDELLRLLDGDPDHPTVVAFASHLERCAACQRALDQLGGQGTVINDTGNCPCDKDIRAFLLGELPDEQASALAAHLEACPRCEAVAKQLEAITDPAVRALRLALDRHLAAGVGLPTPSPVDGTPWSARDTVSVALEAGTSEANPSQPPQVTDWTIPERLRSSLPAVAGHEVLEVLGRGGMGVVYKARHLRLNRLVALKMILGGQYQNLATRVRFSIEAEAVAQLDHPHVVGLYEFGMHEGLPFFALEYLGGGTLAAKLRRDGRFAPRPAAELVVKLADGIAAAHAKGIVHRDLKPANVLLTEGGEPKVADFGLAKVGKSEITATGAVMGTPSYMSPEQAGGRVREVGTPTDVYALGAILYELLTGRPPFVGETPMATVQQVLTCEVVRPRAIEPTISRDLETVCLKCLEKDATKRYRTAEALASDLRAFLDGRQIAARTVGIPERAWKWAKRHPSRAVAFTVGILLSVGLAAAWYLVQAQRDADRQATQQRLGRNSEAVAALLGQCEAGMRAGDADKAAVALEAALARAAEGGADDLAGPLERLQSDLTVLRNLDSAARRRWISLEHKTPDEREVAAWYRAALAEFGADPGVTPPDEVAARVTGSAVRDRLVAALDLILPVGHSERVRAALQKADPDAFRDAFRDVQLAGDRSRLAELASQPGALEQPPEFVALLGYNESIPALRRREILRTAVQKRPGNLDLLMALGHTYPLNNPAGADERVRWSQAAVGVAPNNPATHLSLGSALGDRGDRTGAEAEYREALRLDPNLAMVHNDLAWQLVLDSDLAGAEPEYQEAIRLDPNIALAHSGLAFVLVLTGRSAEAEVQSGIALRLDPKHPFAHTTQAFIYERRGDRVHAEAEYRESLRLDPTNAWAHTGLGWMLYVKDNRVGAEAEYREAIRLDPTVGLAHNNLGLVLKHKGDRDGAIREFKEAIRYEPKGFNAVYAHDNLGDAFLDSGDPDGAVAEYKKALQIDPRNAVTHFSLGLALRRKEDLDGAIAEYKKALEINPKFTNARNNLGWAYYLQGNPDAAIAEYRKVLKDQPKHEMALKNLKLAERLQELQARLPTILAGRAAPKTAPEACELAEFCAKSFQKRYADAARLYEKAFATDPKLAADLNASHRYNAARVAVLAAGGIGTADTAERAALRAKALAWLRADLALRKTQANSTSVSGRKTAAEKLAYWLNDADLSGTRPGPSQIDMPAAERAEWDALWAEVMGTIREAKRPPAGHPERNSQNG